MLEAKLVAEKYLRASGLDWTIVRPGGLKADPPTGALFVSGENTPSCLSRAGPVKGRCGRPASVRPKRLIGRGGPELLGQLRAACPGSLPRMPAQAASLRREESPERQLAEG